MGWEDSYDDLSPAHERLKNSIIKVDRSLVADAISILIGHFEQVFGYELQPEVESKSFLMSVEAGYIAAHLTPAKFNQTEEYYTLLHNPKFKTTPKGWKYTLQFTDGLYDEAGNENDEGEFVVLISSNNIDGLKSALESHWKQRESQK